MRCPEAPSSDQLHLDTSVHALRLWFLVKHMSDSSSDALNNYYHQKCSYVYLKEYLQLWCLRFTKSRFTFSFILLIFIPYDQGSSNYRDDLKTAYVMRTKLIR